MGFSGYFVMYLVRKYLEKYDEVHCTELNEYETPANDYIDRVHAYALKDEVKYDGEIGTVPYTDTLVQWITTANEELTVKLYMLASIKHGDEPNKVYNTEAWKRRANRNMKYDSDVINRVKNTSPVFRIDYEDFFINLNETHIAEWCEFVGINYDNVITAEISEYTQRNREILEKFNVQL